MDVLGAARACLCASILSRELHISSMWSGRSSRGLVRRLGGWFGDWGAVSASLGPGDPSHRASMSLGTTGCRGFDVGGFGNMRSAALDILAAKPCVWLMMVDG